MAFTKGRMDSHPGFNVQACCSERVCTARIIISTHRCRLSPCMLASLTADDSLEASTLSGRFSEALHLPGCPEVTHLDLADRPALN